MQNLWNKRHLMWEERQARAAALREPKVNVTELQKRIASDVENYLARGGAFKSLLSKSPVRYANYNWIIFLIISSISACGWLFILVAC